MREGISTCRDWLVVFFVHPSTDISVAYRPTLDRCIGRHIGRVPTDMSTDISVATRPISRPRYVSRHIDRCINRDIGRHIDRLTADISVDIAADNRPMCGPLIVGGVSVDCRWYIGRLSYNISQKLRLSMTDV